jgi:hypothetical protein
MGELTIARIIAIILAASLAFVTAAHAEPVEVITGKLSHNDTLGWTNISVGVKNNTTNTVKKVRVECGFFHGLDLIGAGSTIIEWVQPGQKAYGTVMTSDGAASNKAECRISGGLWENEEKEEGK